MQDNEFDESILDDEALEDDSQPAQGAIDPNAVPKQLRYQQRPDPIQEFQMLMQNIRVPAEVMTRIKPQLEMQAMQAKAYDEGLKILDERRQMMLADADSKKRALAGEIEKPLPINAAKMALNKAMGYFANSLNPKGGHIKMAEERRLMEIGDLKERRLQRLRTMEADAVKAANRAELMDDTLAKEKAMREAEKYGQQAQILQHGLKDYYDLQDRKSLLDKQIQGQQDAIRLRFMGDVIKANGKGTKNLTPEAKAQLALIEKTAKSDIEGIDNELSELKNNFDMTSEDREAKRRELLARRAERTQQWMDDVHNLIGVTPVGPQEKVPTQGTPKQVAWGIVSKYSDMNPGALQKLMDAHGSDFIEAFGLTPDDKDGIAEAKRMVMDLSRKGYSIRQKIYAEVDQLNALYKAYPNARGGSVEKARSAKIKEYNDELRALGLPPVSGTPGADDENPRGARQNAAEKARDARTQSFGPNGEFIQ